MAETWITVEQAAEALGESVEWVLCRVQDRLLSSYCMETMPDGKIRMILAKDVDILVGRMTASRTSPLYELTKLTEEIGGYNREFSLKGPPDLESGD